jgi:hypothetical protein
MAFVGEPVSASPGHAGIANSFTAPVNRNATPVY